MGLRKKEVFLTTVEMDSKKYIVEFPSWAWEKKNFSLPFRSSGKWENLRGSGAGLGRGILTSSPSLPIEVAWTNGEIRFWESVYG